MVQKVASRFLASPDIYGHELQEPEQSINFVTCHDGFTLNDLVSYNGKHNGANGEDNRDGHNDNLSWNCGVEGASDDTAVETWNNFLVEKICRGVEGASDDTAVETLRLRQIKNFFTLTLLSLGVPMILMGDEIRRTQRGNNNAYCQDNEISWFDWSLLDKNNDLFHFVQRLIAFRQSLSIYAEPRQINLMALLHQSHIEYHGTNLDEPDWSHDSRTIAFTIWGRRSIFHIILNAYWEELTFALPMVNGRGGHNDAAHEWRRIIDTASPAPNDFCALADAPIILGSHLLAQSRSIVVLAAHRGPRHD
jgi:glycogen operon protein